MSETCNQCEKQMGTWTFDVESITNDESVSMTVCKNPICPSYGLVQIPREEMLKLPKKEAVRVSIYEKIDAVTNKDEFDAIRIDVVNAMRKAGQEVGCSEFQKIQRYFIKKQNKLRRNKQWKKG